MAKRLIKYILAAMCSIALLSCLFPFRPIAYAAVGAFEGAGTANEPYLIQSASDLFALSDQVERGETFENEYFLQTNDIRMPTGRSFKPIGNANKGTYFAGNYEGQGYTISNLSITPRRGVTDYALFGAFGGTLSNLGIVDSRIMGAIGAAFVGTGVPNKVSGIYRCYTTAVVRGFARSGMIADNYNGVIEDCWAIGKHGVPFVGYNAKEIVHCFGNGEACEENSVSVKDYRRADKADFADELNETSLTLSMERGILPVAFDRNCKLVPYSRTYAGKGTEEEPYLLSSKEELIRLSASVNGGDCFQDCRFALTNDIDFGGDELIPIGHDQTGHAFSGILDGRGYKISNVVVDRVFENVGRECALFGKLDGTLVNLWLDHIAVDGFVSAGVAVSGTPDSIIYNCKFTNFEINGEYRRCAIVDNFAGFMAAIYYDGDLPFVSVEGRTIAFCASAGEIVKETEHPVILDRNEEFFCGNVTEQMNAVYRYGAMRIGADLSLAREWVGGRPCGERNEGLSGKGTKNDPYLIQSADDLIWFCASVNSGSTYRNQFVRQTKDLDMNGLYFVPIGLSENDTRFYGFYDGDGHTVSNLVISELELTASSGFFGSFGGTLLNFGFESGEVYGTYAAGLVGAGYECFLRNCYSKADVYGTVRSGGLVDTFEGVVVSCFYDNEQRLPMSSNTAQKIFYSCGSGAIVGGTCGSVVGCYEFFDFSAADEAFWHEHNVNLLLSASSTGYERSNIMLWREDAFGFSGEYFSLDRASVEHFGTSVIIACYKWHVFAIVCIVVSVVGIGISFPIERKLRRKKQ